MKLKLTALRFSLVLGVAGALLAVPTAAQARNQAQAQTQARTPARATADHAATLAALNELKAGGGPGAGVYAGTRDASWNLSTGTATINTNDPIGPDEYYRVGSQSKTFTAVAVLKLAEANGIGLDDPIEQHLPGVVSVNGHDGNRITIRHLLQHTSGIPVNGLPLAQARPDGSYTLAALVKDGLRFAPASQPGAAFQYSNTNYEILGMLIEKITGLPLHQAVTQQVIQPLGLAHTRFPAPTDRAVPSPAIHGYRGTRIGSFFFWLDGTAFEPSTFYGSGAVLSTLRDMTAFYQAIVDGTALSPANLAEMEKTFELGQPGSGNGYGLGMLKFALPCGGTAWGHDGAVPGYYSQTLVTEDGRHASVVTNAHLATNIPGAQMYKTLTSALCETPS
ncbi:serine hydrolase domain-containing protein [Streptomyces sp. NBC_01264]|uniref:serine hydrolase domain-containing protein n=1 Tax=Streptomyces sp. NBC_01264 TaxID=2903804 RepID=UPI00224D6D67|nr:serine hydrolase domain-containing protein [Streptomyces sp. NBC_01264]MCX4776048.1 beta-lactamase family protein [Streptomyces sp. NBC_01264]